MLLEVKDLSVQFQAGKKVLTAVNRVSFSLGEQEPLSGRSTSSRRWAWPPPA